MKTTKRFEAISDKQLKQRQHNLQNKNTIDNERKAERLFKEYLKEIGEEDLNFCEFSEEKLDKHLAKFCFAARTQNGQKYKIGTLETIRYSLNRVLKRYGHKFDITKRECTAFTASIKAYEDATTELKQEGKGFTKNHAAVSPEDLYEIYHSPHLDPDKTPRALQNKVQWDIRFYFARRGSENMYNMTKTTFTIKMDEKTGMQYVVKVEDEATKNHKQSERNIVTGYMPAINDDKYCPVRSFIKYTQALHPDSEKLWQTPKYNVFPTNGQEIWYGPGNVGHNKLDKFMSNLAKSCGLQDKGYTNHSLRASGVTTLKRNDYNDKQIMSVTGHRSSASLNIYQKVASEEKLRMGLTLGYVLTGDPSCLTKENEVACVYQQHLHGNHSKQLSDASRLPFHTTGNQIVSLTKREAPNFTETATVTKRPCLPHLQRASSLSSMTVEQSSTCGESMFEENNAVSDAELLKAVSEYEEATMSENVQFMQSSQTESNKIQCMSRQIFKTMSPPTFSNCKIEGGIIINIHKA